MQEKASEWLMSLLQLLVLNKTDHLAWRRVHTRPSHPLATGLYKAAYGTHDSNKHYGYNDLAYWVLNK